MKTALLLALLLLPAIVVAAPVASACDGENPCDPPPMQLCPTLPSGSGKWAGAADWLHCWTGLL